MIPLIKSSQQNSSGDFENIRTFGDYESCKRLMKQFPQQSAIIDLLISNIIIPNYISIYSPKVNLITTYLQCNKTDLLGNYKDYFNLEDKDKVSDINVISKTIREKTIDFKYALVHDNFPFGIRVESIFYDKGLFGGMSKYLRSLDFYTLLLEIEFLKYLLDSLNDVPTIIDFIIETTENKNPNKFNKKIHLLKYKLIKHSNELLNIGIYKTKLLGSLELGKIEVLHPTEKWQEKLFKYIENHIKIRKSTYSSNKMLELIYLEHYFTSSPVHDFYVQQKEEFLQKESVKENIVLFSIIGSYLKGDEINNSILLDFIHKPELYKSIYEFEASIIDISDLDNMIAKSKLDVFIYPSETGEIINSIDIRIAQIKRRGLAVSQKLTPRQIALKYHYLQVAKDPDTSVIFSRGNAPACRTLKNRYKLTQKATYMERFFSHGKDSIHTVKSDINRLNGLNSNKKNDFEIVINELSDYPSAKKIAENDFKTAKSRCTDKFWL